MGEQGLGGHGCYIGRDLYSGASFVYDPWVLYEQGHLRGPSMAVIGGVGFGKSSLVKSYLARQAVFGRRAVVIDPKGEYGPLADWFGSVPIRLEPAGRLRLNPLDPGAGWESQLAAAEAVASSALRRALEPAERTALSVALQAAGAGAEPTLPSLQHHLLHPDPGRAAAVARSPDRLMEEGRDCALELRRLCEGDLRGMFDGPTSAAIDLAARVVVFDLSALAGSPALGILMACVAAWLEARLRRDAELKRIVVLDEAWSVLSDLATARFLRRSWKLARSYGVQNVLVVHRLADLAAAGARGSEQVAIAEGLLADSETRVVLHQKQIGRAHV